MSNGLEERFGRGKIALALPLVGLVAMWLVLLGAQLADLYLQYGPNYSNYTGQQNQFHLSTYLFLVGTALLGLSAVTARSMSRSLESTRLERAVRGFSLVAVFVALIICAIFGVGTFTSNFMNTSISYDGEPAARPSELMRVFNVYLPILLDAAVMVFVIIKAFVNKVDEDETDSVAPNPDAAIERVSADTVSPSETAAAATDSAAAKPVVSASRAQRSLGLGYAVPIIGAVTALLLGLIIADLTRTNLDIWLWVLIQAILGAGMVLGTRFATLAFNYSISAGRRVGATKGARNLNLVLGIIWSAVVIVMSFSKASEAVNKLLVWPKQVISKAPGTETMPVKGPTIEPVTSVAFLQDFLPAFVLILLAVVGTYLLLAERSREAK